MRKVVKGKQVSARAANRRAVRFLYFGKNVRNHTTEGNENIMRKSKRFFSLVLAVICLIGIAGCATYKPDLPQADVESVEKAYEEKFGKEVAWYDPQKDEGHLFYCGADSGYLILIDNVPTKNDLPKKTDKTITVIAKKMTKTIDADIELEWVVGDTDYYAFKDGQFHNLLRLYREGSITKEGMAAAAQTYNMLYEGIVWKEY